MTTTATAQVLLAETEDPETGRSGVAITAIKAGRGDQETGTVTGTGGKNLLREQIIRSGKTMPSGRLKEA